MKIKLVDFIEGMGDDQRADGIGVQWFMCYDRPSIYSERPPKDYWLFLHIVFILGQRDWIIAVRLKKLPFRDKAQFIQWFRARQRNNFATK